jgi:hypothetical protein
VVNAGRNLPELGDHEAHIFHKEMGKWDNLPAAAMGFFLLLRIMEPIPLEPITSQNWAIMNHTSSTKKWAMN